LRHKHPSVKQYDSGLPFCEKDRLERDALETMP
jgi:hypothetical protein